ncbi:hypothetical protein EON81_14485 [bacterium]|nr:MAG: hypothetical protein EON81_14485 [bacterium]
MQKSLTAEEAQAVVRLQLQRETDPSGVSIDDIAEALNLPKSQVEGLVVEVRQSQAQAHLNEMADHRRRDMRRLAMAFAFSILLVGGGFGFYKYREWRYSQGDGPVVTDLGGGRITVNTAAAERIARETVGDAAIDEAISDTIHVSDDAPIFPPEELIPPQGPLPQIRLGSGGASKIVEASGKSLEEVAGEVEKWFSSRRDAKARDGAADANTAQALLRHEMKDPGLAQIPVLLHESGNAQPMFLPLYTGADSEIERLAASERMRILGEAMGIPVNGG